MLAYRGVNLKVASLAHKEAKAMGKVIMKAKGHLAQACKNLENNNH
jgi:hypothetical protein